MRFGKPFRLDRRAVLRGAGVTLALPWLECMFTRHARAAGPQRLVVWFTPNGTIYENWKPTGTETAFTLSKILAPLEAWKSKSVFIEGLHQGDGGKIGGPGDDHMKGMCWALTGNILMSGNVPGGGGAPPAGLAVGQSVDQAIANKIGTMTKFKSLEFGVRSLTVAGNPLFHMVYSGPGTAIQPQQNPSMMFDRVFGNFTPTTPTTPAGPDPNKVSVIDAVIESYTSLSTKIGTADRQRIDQHLTQIRELEKRIKTPGTGGTASGACTKPTKPGSNDAYSESNFVKNGDSQMDLLSMSLACDLTRVASIQWSYSSGGPAATLLGSTINRGHHDISHDGDSAAASRQALTDVDTWYAKQFAALLDRMNKVQEGDATMLDNSVVVWVNELAKGNIHSHGPMCYVVAGGGAGKLKGGRYLSIRDHHNNLLVSLMNVMGVPGNTFGDARYCTGPLKGLL